MNVFIPYILEPTAYISESYRLSGMLVIQQGTNPTKCKWDETKKKEYVIQAYTQYFVSSAFHVKFLRRQGCVIKLSLIKDKTMIANEVKSLLSKENRGWKVH